MGQALYALYVNEDMHTKVKLHSIKEKKSMQMITESALTFWLLKKNKK